MRYTITAKDGKVFEQNQYRYNGTSPDELVQTVRNYESRESERAKKEYEKVITGISSSYDIFYYERSDEWDIDIVTPHSVEDINRINNAILWESYDSVEPKKLTKDYIGKDVLIYMGWERDCYSLLGTKDELLDEMSKMIDDAIEYAKKHVEQSKKDREIK